MGMMAKMRSLAPWFILGVGGLFILFMVLSDSSLQKIMHTRDNNVGSIDGEEISYQNYSQMVEQYRKDQVKRTGKDIDESQMDEFRNQVWDILVTQKLVEEKMKEYGITVTPQEIINTIESPNPPQFLRRNFIDSTGRFNKEAYNAAIHNPQNKQAMIQAEDAVRQQLLQNKLREYLFGTIVISDGEVRRKFIDQNTRMSAKWAFFAANIIPDSTIPVSNEEIQNYYEKHKEEFRLEGRRKLKYVLFLKTATHGDSVGIRKTLESVVKKLKNDTSSFKTYVQIYSDKPFEVDTVTLNSVTKNAANLLYKAKVGDVLGPVLTIDGYEVYKLDKKLRGKVTTIRASHILVKGGGNEEAAKKEAYDIYKQLKAGADFAKLAKEKSEDASAKDGGELGWFTKGQMVPEFEKAAFRGKIGEILKPVKTRFGYHIIMVTGRDNHRYVIEKIFNKITPSPTTVDQLYSNANDFSYLAKKNDFKSEADLMKYRILETPAFTKEASVIPGLGSNKAIINFAFENNVGDVSDVFKLPIGYVVAMVSEALPDEYKPVKEVKGTLTRLVRGEKKLAKTFEIAKEVRSKLGNSNDLSKVTLLDPKANLFSASKFTIESNVPGVGKDYAFYNYTLVGPVGKISGPIKGKRGSYLIKVTERVGFDSTMYSIQKNTFRTNMLQQAKIKYFQEWLENLKKEANIVDNRYKFYK
ncbi:foldase protein PrsA precursor [bacterium BMS3Abin04]|nr:foldase protein PrsA precursor [bacterium BMS3Abin04]